LRVYNGPRDPQLIHPLPKGTQRYAPILGAGMGTREVLRGDRAFAVNPVHARLVFEEHGAEMIARRKAGESYRTIAFDYQIDPTSVSQYIRRNAK
jgi:hypothetical protein